MHLVVFLLQAPAADYGASAAHAASVQWGRAQTQGEQAQQLPSDCLVAAMFGATARVPVGP